MGCSSSNDVYNPYVLQKQVQTVKSTCLIFGMPDSGQEEFVYSINNFFNSICGGKEVPFESVIVGTDRSDRVNWLDEFGKHKRVIASFFFIDISSKSSILYSVKTLNWFLCQVPKENPVFPVALAKTEEDLQNFQYLKEIAGNDIEISTFNDENQSDSRIYSEHIISYVVNHQVQDRRQRQM